MKYFIDTEFHEYTKQPKILGLSVSKPIDTIELISIGIVSEDNKEYYAICNEFDIKAAWNNEWLRENVLRPIWVELNSSMSTYHKTYFWRTTEWSYKGFKRLLKWRGKSRKEIAKEITEFVAKGEGAYSLLDKEQDTFSIDLGKMNPQFYAYYADYDWVVFCWLFGKLIDLPKGFPWYCRDLKQIADETWEKTAKNTHFKKGQNEHNALADAKWNYEFYKFIQTL